MQNVDKKLEVPWFSFLYSLLSYFEDLKKAPPFFVMFLKQTIHHCEGLIHDLRDLTEQVAFLKEERDGWKSGAMAWEAKYQDAKKDGTVEDANLFFARHAQRKMLRRCNAWLESQKFATFDYSNSMAPHLDNLLYYFVAGEEGSFTSVAEKAFGAASSTRTRPSMYAMVKEDWFQE